MLHNKLNIAFNLLPLKAFSLFGQGPVKGARCAALCGLPGIYMPLKDPDHTISLRLRQLIDDPKIVNNFPILCSINWG